jgi:hypothetical protein
MTTQPQPLPIGSRLANGSILLAYRTNGRGDTHVLALSGNEYVTWYLAMPRPGDSHERYPHLGATLSGHYHGDDLQQALNDLAAR